MTHRMNKVFSICLILALSLALIPAQKPVSAVSSDLFFSEYIEGTSNNKALEIYNGTGATVDLAAGGYNVQMYFNGNTSAGLTINLTGTVVDGDVFVLAHSSADPAILAQADQTNGAGWFNGNDAVVLRHGTTFLDVIGQIGYDPGNEWGSGLTSTKDNTLRRKYGIEAGDPDGSDAFDPSIQWDGFPTNTFDGLGSHSIVPIPIVACGQALSVFEGFSASQAISASDPDGTVVDIAITGITPETTGITLNDMVPADSTGGTATAIVNVADTLSPGSYAVEITATNNDTPAQTGSCTLEVEVTEILSIGEVQGSVGDTDIGLTFSSPYVGETVVIQGVIYEKALARTSSGSRSHGFFIQNTAATADGDPNSSDGIYVYIGYYSTLRIDGGGYYTPQVGDEVVLRGPISEYYNLTELSNPFLLSMVRSEVDLDAEVPAFEANPPSDLADANRYWERHEGMRAQVPADSIVLNGRDVFASTYDGEVWVARGDSDIAKRKDPYARRAFRDAHPLDDTPDQLFDNGNGYRIVMGSLGIKATEDDNTALIAPSRTFDTLDNAPIGGVYFSYDKYQIQVGEQLELSLGVDPALNSPPQAFESGESYGLVTFNLENLYDYRNDPFDGCDFVGDPGCPGVNPPFDYVPASQAAYQARLDQIAQQIVYDLHDPDIILAQEVEDQDICTVAGETFTCGATNNADGKPDPLQELATVIFGIDGTVYDAAYDRDGADDRGIVSAYLYRTDRVELLTPSSDDPVLGSDPTVEYRSAGLPYNGDVQNPKALNAVLPGDVDTSTGVDGPYVFTRAPQVGLFRIWPDGLGTSVYREFYVSDNHFSSGPDGRVGQRSEQANYNAAIVAALQAANPDVKVAVGGDLNVYPRPDDPFTPGDPLFPSDQLAGLYNGGLINLYDILVRQTPASAYSYIYEGQAQTLDQIFVTPGFLDELAQVSAAHINSDFPADYPDDGARGTSDHDPQVGVFSVLPTLDHLEVLVYYYDASGAITGNNTTTILIDRLERAARFKARGKQDAYEDQLWAFISQIHDFTPQFIEQSASEALIYETELLLAQP